MKKKRLDVVWFMEVDKEDLPLVGGKGANLGELTKLEVPVPPGFIVTTQSYFHFLDESGLRTKIREILKKLNPDDSKQLINAANRIKELIINSKMPEQVASEIKDAYDRLGGLVAVRSSATAEDLPEASFAGQQRTFLNIHGGDDVVSAVQECWASLFEPRAIFYREQHGLDHLKVGIAVVVQRMVQSEQSGVMFTREPVTNEEKIAIEAVYGLGEAVVSGGVTPDLYLVDKKTFNIVHKMISRQEWQLAKSPQGTTDIEDTNVKLPVPPDLQGKQKLSDREIISLAKLGARIEKLYKFPQDIEWAKGDGKLYIVQTRPITTLKAIEEEIESELKDVPVLLSGSPASPGIGSGPTKIVLDAARIHEVKKGDVLVAEMTTPDFVPAMKRAAAIVTDRGGRTCHAAIVSRELGIPCVVGTGDATKRLKPNQMVTVDGSKGNVYDGKFEIKAVPAAEKAPAVRVKTRTRIYVNLAEPDLAEAVASRHVDGVGLLRAEFMIAQIGEHPRHIIKEKRNKEFIDKLAGGLTVFARAFNPRPVVYRTTDFKTNEYRNLKGGHDYEEPEENPMLGYRGCSRYIRELDVFKLEVEAVKKVRKKYRNLWVMIPFVRTVDEMRCIKGLLEAEGLRQSDDFKLWMMVEVPSNVFLINKFIDVGIDGISIGSNDLTQLILGIDRDSQKLAEAFDERNEAVLIALERVIKVANRKRITSSICGQAPSVYPDLTEKLVEWGITSVSVNPDVLEKTRGIVAAAERRLGLTV
jgi:pyruvate,water dikinase